MVVDKCFIGKTPASGAWKNECISESFRTDLHWPHAVEKQGGDGAHGHTFRRCRRCGHPKDDRLLCGKGQGRSGPDNHGIQLCGYQREGRFKQAGAIRRFHAGRTWKAGAGHTRRRQQGLRPASPCRQVREPSRHWRNPHCSHRIGCSQGDDP